MNLSFYSRVIDVTQGRDGWSLHIVRPKIFDKDLHRRYGS